MHSNTYNFDISPRPRRGRGRGGRPMNRREDFPGFSYDDGRFGSPESHGHEQFPPHHGPGGRGDQFEDRRGHHAGRGGGRGRRAGRGDIRSVILVLLAEQPMHGYQLIQEIVERSGEAWKPSPGAVYPALNLLEDEGLIAIASDSGRKLASLTNDGKAYVAEHQEKLNTVWEDAAGRGAHPARAMRAAIEGLTIAARQIAVAGSEPQLKEAMAVLERSQRELYLILARESETEGDN